MSTHFWSLWFSMVVLAVPVDAAPDSPEGQPSAWQSPGLPTNGVWRDRGVLIPPSARSSNPPSPFTGPVRPPDLYHPVPEVTNRYGYGSAVPVPRADYPPSVYPPTEGRATSSVRTDLPQRGEGAWTYRPISAQGISDGQPPLPVPRSNTASAIPPPSPPVAPYSGNLTGELVFRPFTAASEGSPGVMKEGRETDTNASVATGRAPPPPSPDTRMPDGRPPVFRPANKPGTLDTH